MIRELSKQGIENSVFVPTYRIGSEGVTPDDNVTVSLCFKKRDRLFFDLKQKKIINALEEKFDISSFDIIHAYTLFTDGNCARQLSKKYKIPYVVAVRNTDINSFFKKRPLLRNRGIRIMEDAKKVFFLSDAYREEMIGRYVPQRLMVDISDKIETIPNGIDGFWIENKNENKDYSEVISRIENKNIRIVYAGIIDSNKNIELTISALDTLEKDGWNVSFTIVGKVADENIYKHLVKKQYVYYSEQKTKEELIKIYRKNDIFIMPSKAESFGLVYAEAMSQGLPVIYTRGQGFDGQFEEGVVGFSVDSSDEKELKEKIIMTAKNYKALSLNCLNLSNKFQWETIAERYVKAYTQ